MILSLTTHNCCVWVDAAVFVDAGVNKQFKDVEGAVREEVRG